MNRFRKYVWVALAVLAAGCSKGDGREEAPVPGGVPGTESPLPEGMVPVTLGLSAEGRLTAASAPGSKAGTRAASPDETAVGDLWILQFDTEASAEGSLVHRAYISAQDISQSGTTLTASVMLRGSASSVIVVVANAPESFTASTLPDGATLAELRSRTFAVSSTTGASLPSDASTRLPMFGQTGQIAVSLVGSQSVPVNLTRLASRMSLRLVNSFTSDYPYLQLTSVTLCNAPTKIAYGPLTEDATHLGGVFPEVSADNFRDYDPVTTGLAGSEETSYMWYIAPNRRGTGTATKAEDKSALTAPDGQGSYCTYISIRGTVRDNVDASGRDVVYNVYLGANNIDDYNLWANTAYSARLTITGFNDGQLEVGYDGFGITVGPLDGVADNTITGWHPDTGLDYIPKFLAFTPERIDFGDAASPEAQKVAFSVNSQWRFSYTSGDHAKVIASSSAAAGTDQTGGAQDEPADCEVTFSPAIYKAQSGTPAAGTQYSVVATFVTVDGTATDTRTTELLRTVPALYGEPTVSPAPGTLSNAGETLTATLASNARWSFAAAPGGTVTQESDSYASRSLKVSVPANDTWNDRTVKAVVQYGDRTKEWSYTQPGMSVDGVPTVTPSLDQKISENGQTFKVTFSGHWAGEGIPVRATAGGTKLAEGSAVCTGNTGEATLDVPKNEGTERRILFEYQWKGEWIPIGTGTQAGVLVVGSLYGGGVVYWVNPVDATDFRVVALDESIKTWAASTSYVLGSEAQNETARNGADVWKIAKDYSDNKTGSASGDFATDFQAFAYCYNYQGPDGSDPQGTWYLPSKQELKDLYAARGSVESVITANDGTAFSDSRYWSASEAGAGSSTAWYVHFRSGSTGNNYSKTTSYYVRCVRGK